MTEVLIFIVKVILIVMFAFAVGYKSGLFKLGTVGSVISLAVLALLFSAELYSSLVRDDISLVISFSSSFLNFTLDLSFFIRIFLASLLLGLIALSFGVRPVARIKSAKELCTLSLLIAITVLLALYCTVRIGEGIKISFKFISVFLTAALFGPVWGGAVAAIADVLAFFVNPVGGVFMPQITLVEFLYGFSYGLFFFNMNTWQGFKTMVKLIVCVILQIVFLNLGLTTYFLVPLMGMSFEKLLVLRSAAALINMAVSLFVLAFFTKYMASFRKVLI